MSIFWVIIFGIIQGATEFLPVSSSAHLTILGDVSKIKEEDALPFFLVLHLGTLIALLFFFYKDLLNLGKSFFKREDESIKTVLLIGVTTIVTGILGVLLKNFVEKAVSSSLWASGFLILTTLLLFSTKFLNKSKRVEMSISSMSYLSSALIGFAQGIAVFPGISRSGITIVVALYLGLSRKDAFNYSFLASIPAIFGAFLLDLKDIGTVAHSFGFFVLIAGFFIALVVGFLSLEFLKKIVIRGNLHYFGYYTFLVALAGFAVSFYF